MISGVSRRIGYTNTLKLSEENFISLKYILGQMTSKAHVAQSDNSAELTAKAGWGLIGKLHCKNSNPYTDVYIGKTTLHIDPKTGEIPLCKKSVPWIVIEKRITKLFNNLKSNFENSETQEIQKINSNKAFIMKFRSLMNNS